MKRAELPIELQQFISDYASPNRKRFDPEFRANLSELMPEWLPESASDISKRVQKKKAGILKAASRPGAKQIDLPRTLQTALQNYMNENGTVFDPAFIARLRSVAVEGFFKKDRDCHVMHRQRLQEFYAVNHRIARPGESGRSSEMWFNKNAPAELAALRNQFGIVRLTNEERWKALEKFYTQYRRCVRRVDGALYGFENRMVGLERDRILCLRKRHGVVPSRKWGLNHEPH